MAEKFVRFLTFYLFSKQNSVDIAYSATRRSGKVYKKSHNNSNNVFEMLIRLSHKNNGNTKNHGDFEISRSRFAVFRGCCRSILILFLIFLWDRFFFNCLLFFRWFIVRNFVGFAFVQDGIFVEAENFENLSEMHVSKVFLSASRNVFSFLNFQFAGKIDILPLTRIFKAMII